MLAPDPAAKDRKDEEAALDRELFLPMLALAALTALWGGFCWWLHGHVTDRSVANGTTVMAVGSAVVTAGWLAAAWFFRPKKR